MVWPDPISLVANVFTLLGVPTLTWSTWRLWRDFEKEKRAETQRRAEKAQRKFETEFHVNWYREAIEFYEPHQSHGPINVVPFEKAGALPRPGDTVYLPGETRTRPPEYAALEYEVEKVEFVFEETPKIIDQPCPAILSKILVAVKRERK
jgi:hypothetical protein